MYLGYACRSRSAPSPERRGSEGGGTGDPPDAAATPICSRGPVTVRVVVMVWWWSCDQRPRPADDERVAGASAPPATAPPARASSTPPGTAARALELRGQDEQHQQQRAEPPRHDRLP
ncbi:hypothetical protein ZWY2020_043662 [Hordeum vulgare]|nr:hypothetical protein ZWY2020_043662 [Hordeum vulgare]